ncbi:MAG: helix-turn-helix domain-containing protein [Proteocatella sp.]
MDCKKIGQLIYKLRKEKAMTQKQLADTMNISDKAISKWVTKLLQQI